jgi:hypothetical protein
VVPGKRPVEVLRLIRNRIHLNNRLVLAPHRPGLAPALGLRAGNDGFFIVPQTIF